jgi:AsmA protein
MKKILIGIAAVVVLLIVAALVVPFFVPTDTYKQQIAQQVKSATGRDLAIKGAIAFSLLPNIELKVNDVAFANAPGAATKDMATFKSLLVQLKLMPLLSGNVEVDSFVLVEPIITLEVDKSGKPNWEFQAEAAKPAEIGKAPAAPTKPAAPATDPMQTLAKLKLGDIRLEKGRVSYADARTGDKQVLDNVNVTMSFPDIQSALALNGNVTWRGKVVSLKTKVDKPSQLIVGKASPVSLNVDSEPVKLSFAGSLTNSQPPQAGGDLKLDVPSVRELARWTGNPIQMKGTGLGPLNIAGRLAMAGDKISFSGASLALDAIRGKGDFAVATGGKVPTITAKLDLDKLDVNPYLGEPQDSAAMSKETGKGGGAPGGGGTGQTAAKPAEQGWSTEPIDVSALRSVNADLALSTGGIVYQKIQIGKSALKVALNGGKLDANLTEMALYNGSGKAHIAVDGSGAVPAINQSIQLANIDSFPLLRDAADMKRLEGKANATYTITGHGRNQKEIVQSLNGDGNVKFVDGAIRGVNIAAMVRNVSTAFLKSGFDESQKTDFAELGGTFTIRNGLFETKDLAMQAPLLRLAAAGTSDLPSRTLKFRIEPKLVGSIKGQGGEADKAGLVVPVIVEGTWDHPTWKPDLLGALQAGPDGLLKNPKDLKKGLEEGVKGLIPGMGKPGGSESGTTNEAPKKPADALKKLLPGLR